MVMKAFNLAIFIMLFSSISNVSLAADWNTLQQLRADTRQVYFFGVLDGFTAMEKNSSLRLVCAPNEVSANLAASVAEQYLNIHREKWKANAGLVAIEAWVNKWPCG